MQTTTILGSVVYKCFNKDSKCLGLDIGILIMVNLSRYIEVLEYTQHTPSPALKAGEGVDTFTSLRSLEAS